MRSLRRAQTLAAKLRREGWDVEVWPQWNTEGETLRQSGWVVLWEESCLLQQKDRRGLLGPSG